MYLKKTFLLGDKEKTTSACGKGFASKKGSISRICCPLKREKP
jgi:hypothetical protein